MCMWRGIRRPDALLWESSPTASAVARSRSRGSRPRRRNSHKKSRLFRIPRLDRQANLSRLHLPTARRSDSVCGRVHPEKGVHLLIAAFATAACTLFAGWRLVIVGPTEKKYGGGGGSYLAALARAAGQAQDRILFRGPLFDPIALEREFRSARLFVYPSLAEKGESIRARPA